MKNFEKIPHFEKIEHYTKYRGFVLTDELEEDSQEVSFDLQLIYFQRFVIIRDLLSSDVQTSDISKKKNLDQYESDSVLVHRDWFDLAHPTNNSVEKAKRFLSCYVGSNYNEDEYVYEAIYEQGDLFRRKKELPLFNFLNFLASCHFSEMTNSRQNLSKVLKFLLSEDSVTSGKTLEDYKNQKLFNSIFHTNQDSNKFYRDKEYSYEISHYQDYLNVVEYHELYLKFLKFVISIDYIIKVNEGNHTFSIDSVLCDLGLFLTPNEMKEKLGRDEKNRYEETDYDKNFGYYASLVHEGLLGPNDPNYPF